MSKEEFQLHIAVSTVLRRRECEGTASFEGRK